MYAVIKTGGKQYKVAPGDVLKVEKLEAKKGDIFDPAYLETLRKITDEAFYIPGVDRGNMRSLWTPNTRYTEVVEGGIEAGDVIPSDFQPDAEVLARVKENILKAGIVGRLVANDFSGAMVSAQLLDADPETGNDRGQIDSRDIKEEQGADHHGQHLDQLLTPLQEGDLIR